MNTSFWMSVDGAMPLLPIPETDGLPSDTLGGYDRGNELEDEYGE